jgi:predicted Holliday junction resolvase-like endonuclease
MVFIGKGFDYLILHGLHTGHIDEIIFLEIKTGKSKQNNNEKMIQHTIESKKVYYELMRM